MEKLSRAIAEKEATIIDDENVKTKMRVLMANPGDMNSHLVI